MTFFKCPNCGQEVASNAKVTNDVVEVPPNVVCVCNDGGTYTMVIVDRSDIDRDKVET